ncbi:uncharacterized protein ACO6RY_11706 [Pungitius sinensis]
MLNKNWTKEPRIAREAPVWLSRHIRARWTHRAAGQNDPVSGSNICTVEKTRSKTRLLDTVLCVCTSVFFLEKNRKPTSQSALTHRPQLQGAPERPKKTLASSCSAPGVPPVHRDSDQLRTTQTH